MMIVMMMPHSSGAEATGPMHLGSYGPLSDAEAVYQITALALTPRSFWLRTGFLRSFGLHVGASRVDERHPDARAEGRGQGGRGA
jgi:hypothetical protein